MIRLRCRDCSSRMYTIGIHRERFCPECGRYEDRNGRELRPVYLEIDLRMKERRLVVSRGEVA